MVGTRYQPGHLLSPRAPDGPSRPRQAARRAPEPVTVEIIDENGNVVILDWDDVYPEHAPPCAVAAGATKSRKLERRAQ
jgi:hypothetical protein